MSFGGTEILIIVAVIILFFGAKKIPELARGIGQGITEFKDATDDLKHDESDEPKESSNQTKH